MKKSRQKAREGYEKLAFGGVSDAIRLLYDEHPEPGKLAEMDFFNIAEIRRPKDGSMEIKFFDRLRALEKLEELETGKQDGSALFQAMEESARALSQSVKPPGKEENG